MTKIDIILLGESGVGKTTLLYRLKTGKFEGPNAFKCTINPDFQVKKLPLEDKEISLFIWDTAGSEQHKAITRNYYRKGEGVLLVYDVTSYETFLKLSSWLRELRNTNEEAVVLIAGNKNEDSSKKAVAVSAVKNFAKEENLEYIEMSAKSGKNVEEAFLRLAKKVLIAKEELANKSSKCQTTNKEDNSFNNGTYGKITPKNILPDTDHDVIRLESTPMTMPTARKRACC